jgi:hypothetical protein
MTGTRRLLCLPLALAITAALILAQAGAAHATFAGRDGRIAFWDFNTGQIYAVNPDGTGAAIIAQQNKVCDQEIRTVHFDDGEPKPWS